MADKLATTSEEDEYDWLTYEGAAQVLGLPRGTLYSLVYYRRVPFHRFGPRLVRFRLRELRVWVEAQRVHPRARWDR